MPNNEKKNLCLTKFLSAGRILFLDGKQEKAEVLNALIDALAEVPEIGTCDDLAWGIFHREGLMSTGIGNGIATPHYRLTTLEDTLMAAAVVPDGIKDYETLDAQPVRLVFMIVAGKKQKTIHIRILAEISRLFFDGRLKAAFLATRDGQTCMDILARAE